MDKHRPTRKPYQWLSATIAMLLWGSWSFYTNSRGGLWTHGLVSGIAQGISSFVMTLLVAFLIEKLFHRCHRRWSRRVLPPLLTVLLTGSFLVLVHTVVGTPSVLKTLAPVLTVAFLFALFTNWQLERQAQQSPH